VKRVAVNAVSVDHAGLKSKKTKEWVGFEAVTDLRKKRGWDIHQVSESGVWSGESCSKRPHPDLGARDCTWSSLSITYTLSSRVPPGYFARVPFVSYLPSPQFTDVVPLNCYRIAP
jgi:hypothetical protein